MLQRGGEFIFPNFPLGVDGSSINNQQNQENNLQKLESNSVKIYKKGR